MDPDRWRQVKDICAALLDHDIDRRQAVMRDLCAGDTTLEADVEELLRFATHDGGVLEQPVWAPAASDIGAAMVAWLPDRIGNYRILRLVGEGGMGTVFEAEQDRPRRNVALKLVKPGVADREVLRRFEFESQALGRLQHPGIAQIYEAGTAETALGIQPYLAMEFIHGQTLRE